MFSYIIKRLLLIIPTLLGIITINFIIVQGAPGGPVETMIAMISGESQEITTKFSGSSAGDFARVQNNNNEDTNISSKYSGSRGLDPELIKEIEKLYGFDKPVYTRFWEMIKNYAVFDFGTSFFKDRKVTDLIYDKFPVSISLGLWTTLLVYMISIPLGIKKAIKNGLPFDVYSSSVIIIGVAIPSFVIAVMLIIFFSGGEFLKIFPIRGLVSDNFQSLSSFAKIKDYFWHVTLPVISMTIGGFASLTFLVKNSFLEEINKQYVITARSKGLSQNKVFYGHIFRNAMLIVISDFPVAFAGILFTGSLLIEIIFSLDGLGLLGFEAIMNRDYPIIFGTLYIYSFVGLVLNLIGDIMYMIVDPRINFEKNNI